MRFNLYIQTPKASMTRRYYPTIFALAALLALAAGCSSSSTQTTDDQQPTADRAAEKPAEQEAAPEPAQQQAEPAHPTVAPKSLIGKETSGGMPEGCPGEWAEIEGRSFPGTTYACEGFYAPDRYPEASVVIGVDKNKVRRVSVQAFYGSRKETSDAYFEIKDGFQQTCDREGGTGRHVLLQCDGYLLDLQVWEETKQIRLVFGLENWDLPS